MTCIVGIVNKETKNVTIGADSASSDGGVIFIRKDPKVFKNDNFVIGCTSSFRMIQLLRFSFKPPEIGTKDIYEYMCTDFINEVRKCFKNGGYINICDNEETGGFFLVGYKDRLFKIEDDFQVGENINGIDAVGCGANYALGALYALYGNGILIEDKVEKALEAAELFSNSVRKPFILIST